MDTKELNGDGYHTIQEDLDFGDYDGCAVILFALLGLLSSGLAVIALVVYAY